MKPDRSNYEIWLIDWLDGKLDEIQVKRLLLFLEENPELKEEFSFCSSTKLDPPSEKFMHKQLLKKAPYDITDKQFEYLCAGYIENDLSDEHIEELKKIVSDDFTKENELELFKQTKLIAPDIQFSNKQKLLRTTPFQKALKISVAAAAIAIFIVASQFTGKDDLSVNSLLQSSVDNEKTLNVIAPETVSENAESNITSPPEKIAEVNIHIVEQVPKEIENIEKDEESTFIPPQRDYLEPVEIPNLLSVNISSKKDYPSDILLSSKTIFDTSDSEPDVLSRNLAQLFREKILKEKTPDNSPIKTYELAAVGVYGLNKLLGWEMDFRKNNDENGKVKTIYFSSRLLEMQLPVNKSE